MTDQPPEALPEGAGDPVDVQIEGSVTDGKFEIKMASMPNAMLVATFNEGGTELLPTLIALMAQAWPEVLESIYEAVEAEIEQENK